MTAPARLHGGRRHLTATISNSIVCDGAANAILEAKQAIRCPRSAMTK